MRLPPIISGGGGRWCLHLRKKTKIKKTKKQKQKKKENLGGWAWELRTPEWRVVWGGRAPLPVFCVRGALSVWCSY